YLMLKRLGPLFDQYAPRELAVAIRAQTEALAQAVPEGARAADNDDERVGIRPSRSKDDREKSFRERIDRAKTSEERDELYIELAFLFSEDGDVKAREFVDKIEDTELRNRVRVFVGASLLEKAVNKKKANMILDLVRTVELTQHLKSWGVTKAAKLLSKTVRARSLPLI